MLKPVPPQMAMLDDRQEDRVYAEEVAAVGSPTAVLRRRNGLTLGRYRNPHSSDATMTGTA